MIAESALVLDSAQGRAVPEELLWRNGALGLGNIVPRRFEGDSRK